MAVSYGAFGDFSILQNPNAVWTYETGGLVFPLSGSTADYAYWTTTGAPPDAPAVIANTTSSTVTLGSFDIPPFQVTLDPETASDSTVAFTAPTKAFYVISGGFVGTDTSEAPHLVTVAVNGHTAFQSLIETYNQSAPFLLTYSLNAGDTVAFIDTGNGTGNAAVALSASVVAASRFAWRAATSGDFDNPARWSPAAVPGNADIAVLGKSGAYTVTSSNDRFLSRLTISNAEAVLAIAAGTFSTEQLINAGSVNVGDGTADAAIALEGSAENSGTITLAGESGAAATLDVGAFGLTLSGGGTVALGGASGGVVTGFGGLLRNLDNTISGSGQLGDASIQLVNSAKGVIAAQGLLQLATAAAIDNSGTLRAASGGTLDIQSDMIARRGGVIAADGTGATVILDNITLQGRINLQSTAGGVIAVGAGLVSVEGTASISGHLAIDAVQNSADSALMFDGPVTNTGTMTLTGGAAETAQLQVCNGTVELSGGGAVVLAGVAANTAIVGTTPNSRLVNIDNTIEGAGTIGQDSFGDPLRLINQALGTIDANVAGETLLIDTASLVTNSGVMRASNGGALVLRGTIEARSGSLFDANGGDIVLDNTDLSGEVILQSDLGGAITVAPGLASIEGDIGISGDVDVDAVANGADTELMLEGDVGNSGIIHVTGSNDTLAGPHAILSVCDGPVTLEGGGSVVLSGQAAGIFSTSFRSQLTNVDNTIEGEGLIGDGFLPIANLFGGTIDANVAGGTLMLNAGFNGSNAGLIEATNGGILGVTGSIEFAGTGVLKTIGTGSSINLDSVAFRNATLDASGGGPLGVGAALSLFDGHTRIKGGLNVDASANNADTQLELNGIVDNQGTITLAGGLDSTVDPAVPLLAELVIGPRNTTLQGGGSVVLSGDPDSTIVTGTSSATRLSNVDNTIEGAGQLGQGSLMLVNQISGTIDANVTGKSLVIDTGTNAIVNRGTLEASDGGTLVIASTVLRQGMGLIDGGTLDVQQAINIGVSFTANGGTLQLDSSASFRGSVAGLADSDQSAIDFTDIAFASVSASFKENSSLTQGALRLSDGTDSARVVLLGQYAANFTSAPAPGYTGFVLADDGTASHGTKVTYLAASST